MRELIMTHFWFSRFCRRFAAGCGFLLLFIPTLLPAEFSYTITPNLTVTITGYTGVGGIVTIPDTIEGLPVTSIGDYALRYPSLTGITIPNSVTNIGIGAFTASGLIIVTMGNSVAHIGAQAFYKCASLSSIS